MRLIGKIDDAQLKQRFLAYLAQQDIPTTVFTDGAGWSVWGDDENKTDLAREAFASFEADPQAERFVQAETAWAKYQLDDPIEMEEAEAAQDARSSDGEESSRGGLRTLIQFRRQRRPYPMRRGYTVWMALLSVFGALLINFNLTSPAGRWMAFCESPLDMQGFDSLKTILSGQLWRLISPSFVYTDSNHLLFGVIFLYHFGTRIESLRGPLVLSLLVLGGASFANLAQALAPAHVAFGGLEGLAGGAHFSGMSGVVFGLFGFIWAQSVRFPRNPLRMDTITIIVVIAWQTICLSSPEWGFPNVGHLAGLIYGIVAGSFYGTLPTPSDSSERLA